jgi:hypothetical protein
MAFEAIKFIATESGDLKEGKRIPCYKPYALSSATNEAPVKFEAEFYSVRGIGSVMKLLLLKIGFYLNH